MYRCGKVEVESIDDDRMHQVRGVGKTTEYNPTIPWQKIIHPAWKWKILRYLFEAQHYLT